jgi:ABC-type Zn uptake system ZnuABC Zn-binding protein ZnuA
VLTRLPLLLLAALAAPASSAEPGTAAVRPLGAVATITPLGWLLEELGGERVRVSVLVPPGASPHAFEPRPSDLVALAGAALFVTAGPGIDDWVARLALALGPRPLVLLDAVGSATPDPHFWLDPIVVRDRALPALEAGLAGADSAGRAYYAERRRAFAHELTALDAEIRAGLAGVPRRPLVPTHAAFGAFAARYGVPLLEPVQQRGAEEPTPRTLARLADRARGGTAAAVLVEPQLPPDAAEALAEALGVPAVLVDGLGDPAVPERGSYAALLRFDAAAFRRALTGEAR